MPLTVSTPASLTFVTFAARQDDYIDETLEQDTMDAENYESSFDDWGHQGT